MLAQCQRFDEHHAQSTAAWFSRGSSVIRPFPYFDGPSRSWADCIGDKVVSLIVRRYFRFYYLETVLVYYLNDRLFAESCFCMPRLSVKVYSRFDSRIGSLQQVTVFYAPYWHSGDSSSAVREWLTALSITLRQVRTVQNCQAELSQSPYAEHCHSCKKGSMFEAI